MSEVTTSAAPAALKPAVATPETVTDTLGRVLTIKRLDALSELDLIEAAGAANSANARWMVMATLAACVIDINGVPCPFPATRQQLRDQVRKVGSEGIAAVVQALTPDEAATVDEADTVATAKN